MRPQPISPEAVDVDLVVVVVVDELRHGRSVWPSTSKSTSAIRCQLHRRYTLAQP